MNNFNQSSIWANIELNISYDCALSQIYFDNSVERIENSKLFIFVNNSQMSVDMIETHFKLDTNDIPPEELKQLFDRIPLTLEYSE